MEYNLGRLLKAYGAYLHYSVPPVLELWLNGEKIGEYTNQGLLLDSASRAEPSGIMHHAIPQLRQSTANILTDLGWFAATFHVPSIRAWWTSSPPASASSRPPGSAFPARSRACRSWASGATRSSWSSPPRVTRSIETAGSIGRTPRHQVDACCPRSCSGARWRCW